MERNPGRQRRAVATMTFAIVMVAAAGNRSSDLPIATPVEADTVSSTTPGSNERASGPFGFRFDARGDDDLTTGTIEVRGIEQTTIATSATTALTTATTASPTTTSPSTPVSTTTPTTVPTTTAPPVTLATADTRGRHALGRISYDWGARLPGWTITFSPGRSGVFGYTYVAERRIEIFVRDDQSDSLLTHVIAHELGHAVDVTLNNSDDRAAWAAARGIENVQWWPGDGVTDFSTGAGDFAEAFAVWQVGPANYRGKAAGTPSGEQLSLLASLANR